MQSLVRWYYEAMIADISDWIIRIPGTNLDVHFFQISAAAFAFFLLLAFVAVIAIPVFGSRKRRD